MCAHVRLQSNLGSGRFSRQHCTQKMAPQWRQWCLRTMSENFTLHPRHSSALASSSCANTRIRMHVSARRLGELNKSRAGKRQLVDAAGAAERQSLTHSGAPLIFRTSSRTPLSRPLPPSPPPLPPPKPHPRGPPHAIALPTLAMVSLRIDVDQVTALVTGPRYWSRFRVPTRVAIRLVLQHSKETLVTKLRNGTNLFFPRWQWQQRKRTRTRLNSSPSCYDKRNRCTYYVAAKLASRNRCLCVSL